MELLEEFKKEYATMEQRRQELTNAEKLFDLPITTYPDVMEVDRDIRNMSKVYELYEAQKVSDKNVVLYAILKMHIGCS